MLEGEEKIPQSIKTALILSRAPLQIKDQIELHAQPYEDDPEKLIETIESFMRSRRMSNADPNAMDVSRLGGQFQGSCHNCGLPGPCAADCRRGGKDKGQGQEQRQWGQQQWRRNGLWHRPSVLQVWQDGTQGS